MVLAGLKRNIFQRLLGIPATRPPQDAGCWSRSGDRLTIELQRAPELDDPGGAIRLEATDLPERVLVFRGSDDAFHAICNRCTHGRRRVDLVPDDETLQCCSIGRSTFDYEGHSLAGPGRDPLTIFPVHTEDGKLIVELGSSGTGADDSQRR